jgi:acyl-CoA synthetase (AMP-forming)/AMP-acid ligase II
MAMGRTRYLLEAEDRFWDPLPMFHMSSLLPLMAVVDAGASFVTMTHFEVDTAVEQIITHRPTVLFPSFPTITAALIEHPGWASVDLGQIRVVNNVAPPEMLRRFQAAYPEAVQVSAYGLSEAGGVISFNELTDDLEARTTSCGRPFAGIQVRIVDPESLRDLPQGERGEILISGYSLFEGYFKDPNKTDSSMVDGTWLRTGDLCSLDPDGRISYHGRLKDMLKVGGENVAAVEIESFLATHPDVNIVQVVGLPDERLEEVPMAFVELMPNSRVTGAELIEYCRGQIASFKVPRAVRFVSDWPMSATKIQKFKLKEMLNE